MFGHILIADWALFWGAMFLLVLSPVKPARIPHADLIRPFMVVLALTTIVYGLVRLYRHGMKHARRSK
jgi:hypothetical protein